MPVRTVIRDPISEETTQLLTTTIRDENGVAIPGASLTTLTLTLYALDASKSIINNRNRVNILNANGGTVDGNGLLSLVLVAADSKVIDTINITVGKIEEHILLFEWTYAAGAKQGRQEILLKVVNMEKVPAP